MAGILQDKVAFIHTGAAENVLIELVQKAKSYPETMGVKIV